MWPLLRRLLNSNVGLARFLCQFHWESKRPQNHLCWMFFLYKLPLLFSGWKWEESRNRRFLRLHLTWAPTWPPHSSDSAGGCFPSNATTLYGVTENDIRIIFLSSTHSFQNSLFYIASSECIASTVRIYTNDSAQICCQHKWSIDPRYRNFVSNERVNGHLEVSRRMSQLDKREAVVHSRKRPDTKVK